MFRGKLFVIIVVAVSVGLFAIACGAESKTIQQAGELPTSAVTQTPNVTPTPEPTATPSPEAVTPEPTASPVEQMSSPTSEPTPEPTQDQAAAQDQQPLVPSTPATMPGGGNKIVLTFDDSDGSGVLVTQILDTLARYRVKAIFFPTGSWANGSGAPYVQRMLNEGHLVCNHTRDHADLSQLSRDGIVEQVLGGAGVGSCSLLRPPYGAHNSYVDSVAAELGYSIYMWTIDTMDWNRRYAGGDQEILSIVLSQAYPGAVVLMHMHVENTVRVLPAMIEGLQAAGYELSW